MFDRNQNILPKKKNVETSSNMHATRSNIVDPTNVLFTMFERVVGALLFSISDRDFRAL